VTISSLVFSVLPDLGLIYFYFFNSTISHRQFFPHLPIVMLATLIITIPLYRLKFFEKMRVYYVIFFVNWFVHLVIDTFTERIHWLYPFRDEGIMLIEIPARYSHWIISFVLHWSFLLELAIIAVALALLFRTMKHKRAAKNNIDGEGLNKRGEEHG